MNFLRKSFLGALSSVLMNGIGNLEARAEPVTNIIAQVTNNTDITWNWVPEYFTAASSSGNGNVSGTTNNWIEHGSNVNVQANADQFYGFDYWTGAPSGKEAENPLQYAANEPRNLVAHFKQLATPEGISHAYLAQYNLPTNSNPNGDDDLDGYSLL